MDVDCSGLFRSCLLNVTRGTHRPSEMKTRSGSSLLATLFPYSPPPNSLKVASAQFDERIDSLVRAMSCPQAAEYANRDIIQQSMNRTPSPTRSLRSTSSNLIRSYTTSSDMSASEQLAAIAKARQDRKHQREARPLVVNERTTGATTDLMLEATQGDVEEQAVVQDSSTTTKSSTPSLSHLPKLRIQPSSDRSFTPSVPSTPSRTSQDIVESNFGQTQEEDGSSTTIAASSPLRQTYSVVEIPPFRPSPSVSTHTSPASTPPPTNVVLAHGLLDRLKARRASQSASGSQCPTPSAYESGDNVSAATPPDRESRSAGSASSESVNEASISPPCERAYAAETHQSTLDRPLSPVPSAPESLPPLTSTSTAPSSFVTAARDDDEGDDAISELSRVFANRERSKSRSRIYGRYGEEVEHDFAALSDIQ